MSRRAAPDTVESDLNVLRVRPRRDRQIWGIYFGLVVVSLIELYSASSREVVDGHILAPLLRHAMLLFGGFLIMVMLQRVRYTMFKRLTWAIVAISIIATIYTMFYGQVINGARRSFSLGLFSVQPSELLKFSAALLIARVLSDGQIKVKGRPDVTNRSLIVVAVTVLIFGLLLVNQGLTNTLLLMAISVSMMCIGGVPWRKLLLICLIYGCLGGCYILVKSMRSDSHQDTEQVDMSGPQDRTELRKKRILNFLATDKYKDTITSENQQEQYSYIAQANGGTFGVFPGNSRETARLPLAFSDYIYAIVIEDTGLIGGVVVLLLYLWLLARAGRIASQCKKAYPALLVIGMAVFIVYQALFHMAIVTGVFPVSGQPLPFISKGGSSVIVSSIALGMMLSVSRFAARKNIKAEKSDKMSDLSDNNLADNPTQL